MNICSENSFIIHSRDYGETSLILEVITENSGPFTLLGKGVKKKKDFSILQPFKELKITFSKKSNFPILSKYEVVQNFSVIKNQVTGINMTNLVLDKGTITIDLQDNEGASTMDFVTSGCSLESVSESLGIDGNVTMDFSYIFSIQY